MTHHGYMRSKGGRWRCVCTADDWGTCWERLLLIPGPEQFIEKTVLEAGRRVENDQRKRGRRCARGA